MAPSGDSCKNTSHYNFTSSNISTKKNEKKNKLALVCLLFLYAYKYSLTTCKFWTNFKDISCSLMHISVLTLECIHVLAGMPITVSFGFVSKNKFTSFCF